MRKKTSCNRIMRVVICFFVILGLCTWISRFTKSVLTPVVKSGCPVAMMLPHTISGTGLLSYRKVTPVYLYAGILVDEVFVTVGQNVQKGDALVQYNLARLEKEKQDKEFELEELKSARSMTERSLEREKTGAEIVRVENAVKQLNDLIEQKGIFYADVDGMIQVQNQKEGDYSLDAAAFMVGTEGQGYIVSMDIPEEQRSYVQEGDAATVATEKAQDSFVIDSLFYDSEKHVYTIQIVVEGADYYAGERVQVEMEHDSRKYDTCLPLAALHSGGAGNSYVLIEREKNTILGTELIAEKVNVKIEDSNMEYAAITSTALRTEDRVIISSDKNVEAGDIVREKQE